MARLVTWNLWGFNAPAAYRERLGVWRGALPGTRSELLGPGEVVWRHRRRLVLAALRAAAPDLVALQEAARSQAAELGAALAMEVSEAWPQAQLARVPVVGFEVHELPYPPALRAGGSRTATLATAALDGTPVRLCNLHLPLDPALRLACALSLVDRLRELPSASPLVVCGDFNEPVEGEAVQALLQLGLSDAEPAAALGPTFPNPGLRTRIDLVLVRGLRVSAARLLGARPARSGLYASDHCGVLVELGPAR